MVLSCNYSDTGVDVILCNHSNTDVDVWYCCLATVTRVDVWYCKTTVFAEKTQRNYFFLALNTVRPGTFVLRIGWASLSP